MSLLLLFGSGSGGGGGPTPGTPAVITLIASHGATIALKASTS